MTALQTLVDDDDQPKASSLEEARASIKDCRRCPLYEFATQAVFGEGPARADIMFIGEQPGDQEDREGRPFVGPAGRILDEALAAAGIDRDRVYVTNAVKHFKFVQRGKRRLHQRPNAGEIAACRFWLNLERALVNPRVIVALGATAGRALLDRPVTISSLRGRAIELDNWTRAHVTIHPSYLLRLGGRGDTEEEEQAFVADLQRVREAVEET